MGNKKYEKYRTSNILAVKNRRLKLRGMAVELLGGKCSVCGYCRDIKALDFHHLDEKTKKLGLSDHGLTRSWEKVKEEVLKCVLLCANCHREVHSGLTRLVGGTKSFKITK